MVTAGCATREPEVGPWGYEFALGQFRDARPLNEDRAMTEEVQFRTEKFMNSWRRTVGRSIFGHSPALLDVVLQEYAATHSAKSFSISMEVRLRGRDSTGVIAETTAKCSAVRHIGPEEWGDFGQQVAVQGDLRPLTPSGRDATMWQKVLDVCVKDLAIQFGQAVDARERGVSALQ